MVYLLKMGGSFHGELLNHQRVFPKYFCEGLTSGSVWRDTRETHVWPLSVHALWGGAGWGKLGRNELHGSNQKVCKINFEKSKSRKVERFHTEFRNVEKSKSGKVSYWISKRREKSKSGKASFWISKSRKAGKSKSGKVSFWISKSRKECHMKTIWARVWSHSDAYMHIQICMEKIPVHKPNTCLYIHVQANRI